MPLCGELSTAARIGKTEIGDIDHIRVTQPSRGTGFAPEAFDKFGPLHVLRSDDLHSNGAFGPEVSCQIHGPHPSAPELTFDLVFSVQRLACEVQIFHNGISGNSNGFQLAFASNYDPQRDKVWRLFVRFCQSPVQP